MSENPSRFGGRAVVIGLLVTGAAGIAWLFSARDQAMSKPIPAVALLPFQSSSPAVAYFADGVTIELINALSKVEKLRVSSWNSVTSFRGKAADLKTLREDLQAAAVVDGTLREQGDRLLVTVKLIDARSGESIWSDSLDRPKREIFQIQERISKGIVYALNVPMRVDPQRILVPVRTDSMVAYEDYLRARSTTASLVKRISYAEKATLDDPRFSPAYGLLAAACALLSPLTRDSLEKAKQSAHKAIDMDSSNGEAHAALGMALGIGDWDWKAAKLEFQRAVEWSPNSSQAHAAFALGYLMPTGDLDGAEYEAHRALELDRTSCFANRVMAEVMQARNRAQEALSYSQTASAGEGDCFSPRRHSAAIGSVAGDANASFALINKSIDAQDPEIAFLQSDLQFAWLRKDPRFTEALKRLKLRE